eukprot:365438-Chlamydomonas_euryale.AAC.4
MEARWYLWQWWLNEGQTFVRSGCIQEGRREKCEAWGLTVPCMCMCMCINISMAHLVCEKQMCCLTYAPSCMLACMPMACGSWAVGTQAKAWRFRACSAHAQRAALSDTMPACSTNACHAA